MGLLGWSWASEESPLKQESMEILALDTVVSYNAKKASKGGETGRRESVIGCFGNPFLKETQRLVRPEWGKGSCTPGCSVGGLGKPLPHRDGGRQLPSLPAWHWRWSGASHLLSSPWAEGADPEVGEGWTQQLLGGRGAGGAVPRQLRLLALPAVPTFITQDVPFRQISSLVLDFYWAVARLRCPRTLPWVPHAPTSTQDLVPAQGDAADGQ